MRMVCVSLLFLMICGFFSLQSSETAVLFFFSPRSKVVTENLRQIFMHYTSQITILFILLCFCLFVFVKKHSKILLL